MRNQWRGVFSDFLRPKSVTAMLNDDSTYRPENVTRVELWVDEGGQAKDFCYDPSADASYDYPYEYVP